MTDFFSEADCDIPALNINDNVAYISLERANRLLRERAQVVRGSMREDGTHRYFGADPFPVMPNTHTALLVCVTPIARDSADALVEALAKLDHRFSSTKLSELIDRARALKAGGK